MHVSFDLEFKGWKKIRVGIFFGVKICKNRVTGNKQLCLGLIHMHTIDGDKAGSRLNGGATSTAKWALQEQCKWNDYSILIVFHHCKRCVVWIHSEACEKVAIDLRLDCATC